MKHTAQLVVGASLITSVLISPTASAERQTYQFTGTLSSFDSSFYSQSQNDQITNFTLNVEVETTAVLVYADPETEVYTNAVYVFTTNSSGPGGGISTFPMPNGSGAVNEIVYSKTGGVDMIQMNLDFVTESNYRFVERLEVSQVGQPFVQLTGDFVGVLTGSYQASVIYEATAYDPEQNTAWYIYGEGLTTSVLGTIDQLDLDGDGIGDNDDVCEASILDETVVFDGWYDSGVPNYVDDSGCSIMDYYAACEAEEQEAPVRGIRSVRSGPSNCEKAVSYDLVADGVISYAEARMLRSALYESSTSSGPQ